MKGFRLATKIALPFVALFALLLAILGAVLAREILREVERRVDGEQRFVLSVAAYREFPLSESFLRAIRDRARGGQGAGTGPELVAIEERAAPISTFDPNDAQGAAVLRDFLSALGEGRAFPGLGAAQAAEQIQSARLELAGRMFRVWYASRWPGGRRRDFFLIYPEADIVAAQTGALARIAGLGLGGLALAALLARLVAHWVCRPVRRLATDAERLARGGLEAQLRPGPQAARDEIGRLADAFHAMVQSLRRSQEDLVKAERLAATGKLAATVAHEIRNPLTSLRMTVQLLAQRASDAATGEAYQVVLSEIDRLALIVEELLTFARPRPPQRVPTDLNRLAAESVKFLQRQFDHARVQARLEPDAGLPSGLALDPDKMRQLLYNLLLNAMQAVVRGGTVTVRTQWQADARRAILEVADTGPGIAAEVRERLFEPFVSTKPGGGLGLAVAKQIVEEHAGRIGFETSQAGTTFRVELPA